MTVAAAETLEFKAELKQLLHLITHSLYSNQEIFLRELISNASDAINKLKFDSLQHEDLLEGEKDWKIKIRTDREAGTLTISDNGIGLSREEAVENLGTIAKSGTRAFLEAVKEQKAQGSPELIGQFGVGFYSAFMVADRVTVVSRRAGLPPEQAVKWESDGQGAFSVEPANKPGRGSDVTLHLKPDAKEYLDEWRLRAVVRKFSDFLEHPVAMDVEQEGEDKQKTVTEEVLNSRRAIWLRNKSEVKPEEYEEFYKQISHDTAAPAKVIHYTAEGVNEFKVLLFIPAHKTFDLMFGEVKHGLKLYVQRVLIMDHCEAVLPAYLRFVKGVVDSSDLPLNISRELLQQNPMLDKIQRNVVRNVLDGLAALKNTEPEKYAEFFRELGEVLKEGAARDFANKDKVADLLLYESLKTEPGKYVSLGEYVEKMPADQTDLYYLTGEDRDLLANSPYLEAVKARGWDVLFMTDPVDEYALSALREFKGKKLKAVDQGDLDAASDKDKPADEAGAFQGLFAALKEKIGEIKEVRLSKRLTDSAACLVTEDRAASAHLERLMQKMGREVGASQRILELNGAHPAVQALKALHERDANDPRVELYGRLLYDQAVIAEGSRVKDPAAFARRVNELLTRNSG